MSTYVYTGTDGEALARACTFYDKAIVEKLAERRKIEEDIERLRREKDALERLWRLEAEQS